MTISLKETEANTDLERWLRKGMDYQVSESLTRMSYHKHW